GASTFEFVNVHDIFCLTRIGVNCLRGLEPLRCIRYSPTTRQPLLLPRRWRSSMSAESCLANTSGMLSNPLCGVQLLHSGVERDSKEAVGNGIDHRGRECNPSNAKPLDEDVVERHVDAAIDRCTY